jgi:glyoxylase-like metal-dependent hydrolase (beta-lactamase superfamily II)
VDWEVKRLVVGPLATNCYVVAAAEAAVVIDPGAQVGRIMKAVDGLDVLAVLVTHGHSDHVGAVDGLLERTTAPFLAPSADAALIAKYVSAEPARLLSDGDRLEFGPLSFEVIATPGHTPGSCCYYAPGVLFSGDTLFAGGVGRTDLPGGSGDALFTAIRERIFTRPDDTVVYPGHGEFTTVGREKETNPFFGSAWV